MFHLRHILILSKFIKLLVFPQSSSRVMEGVNTFKTIKRILGKFHGTSFTIISETVYHFAWRIMTRSRMVSINVFLDDLSMRLVSKNTN